MKKYILWLFIFAVLSFTSCKKEYTCHCIFWTSNAFYTGGFEGDVKVKSTKSKASEACTDKNESVFLSNGDHKTTECELKN